MTRPKAQKNRSRATTAADGGGPAPAAHQQHAAQQQYAAGRRRQDGPAHPGGGAAAAAAAAAELPEVDELERKRMQVAEELRLVEKQIFDLETNYFQISSAMGNAVRGYEGFLGGSKKSATAPVLPEERLFSWSSLTGQLGGTNAE